MHDHPVLARCPRCLAPLAEYCYHRGGVTGDEDHAGCECALCHFTNEQTEAEGVEA